MTISTAASEAILGGNGATTAFNFSFVAGVPSNVIVTYTDTDGDQEVLAQGSQYTLALNAAGAGQIWGVGGTVTYPLSGAPIPVGSSLTIQRIVPLTQLTSISNQGDFYPQAVERALDTLCMEIQQVQSVASRAIVVNPADPAGPTPLPVAALRANKIMGFDSSGQPTVLSALDQSSETVIATHGVTPASLAQRFGTILNVVDDYGAVPDGITDSTTAIQRAENSVPVGGCLYFPPGVYMINSAGITKKNGISWSGPGGSGATLRAISGPTWTGDMVHGETGAANLQVSDLCFDWNNAAAAGVPGCLHFVLGSNVVVERCMFLRTNIFGLILDGTTQFQIRGNYIQRDAPSVLQNEAILVSPFSGVPGPGVIDGNFCIKTAMDLAGSNISVTNNYIFGWSYGSGITVGPDANTSFWVISNNSISDGVGTDSNGTTATGIENWAPFSTISGNICTGNAGDGLDNNALNCVVSGNVCLNNGQDTSYSSSGIGSSYLNASNCGNFSVITGNICADLQGSKTQKYGYADRDTRLTDITIIGNSCFGNAVAPMNIIGMRCDFHGPKVWGNTGFGGGTVASLAFFTANVVVGGATVGDVCSASANLDLGGAILFAWCHVPGQVQFTIQNATANPITLVAGTITVCAEKHPNYVEY